MQATNGFAFLFRLRTRVIGCSMVIAMALSALVFASGASAATPPATYVGTGDSLAFGYSQQLFNENFPGEDPNHFNHGYVNNYFALEQAAKVNNWKLINNGCPGETSDSMIGNAHLSKELAPFGATGEAPCAYHNVGKFHLHHEYGGDFNEGGKKFHHSQMENTLEVLVKEFHKDKNLQQVKMITLNIGANDILHQVAKCEAEVKAEYEAEGKSKNYGGSTPEESVKNCIILNASPTFKHILTNLTAMLYAIRHGSQFCANDPDGIEADGCDPNGKGVDYTGKIVVQGYYDPYGRVFCAGESFASPGNAPASCVPGKEILESSNTLEAVLNFQERAVVEGEPFAGFKPEGCYANPQSTFNPGITGPTGAMNEPFKLQTLTNMDNKTTSKGKANGDGVKNDIHPTPLGYKVLSEVMNGECGL